MTVSIATVLRAPHTVAVAPTETLLDALTREETRSTAALTVQIYNPDASQTCTVILYRKQTGMTEWSVWDSVSFAAVLPLTSVSADFLVGTTDLIEIRGTQSGAGGDVQIGIIRRAANP
jgi:hypothetical protein